jgi:hypothetical protein
VVLGQLLEPAGEAIEDFLGYVDRGRLGVFFGRRRFGLRLGTAGRMRRGRCGSGGELRRRERRGRERQPAYGDSRVNSIDKGLG